jgi:mRNA-degrading endonuclease YafQ of YafQ-DinJ toxin-antitoxin module
MVIELIWDSSFKKAYKKKVQHNSILRRNFYNSLDLFVKKPFDKKLRTHKLIGQLKEL